METPIAFIIFNRPDKTRQVFSEIAKARPKKLLVVADGPRCDRTGEEDLCRETREIIDLVDWDCEILKNYSDVNLGCKRRVSSGLDWVFDTVEEAIVLEDDCLPDQSFFMFCETLLDRYRHDENIMCISGDNFQFNNNSCKDSYYYSRYTHIWGWASWRRAWNRYDVSMSQWPDYKASGKIKSNFDSRLAAWYWTRIFDSVYRGDIDTWDYQWLFASLRHDGLNVIPQVNLISNIGFGDDSTHTKEVNRFSNIKTEAIKQPLIGPLQKIYNAPADNYTESKMFSGTWAGIILRKLSNALRK
ncbi:MAG: glycosyltransferase family 2 protein [Candidatus Sedimenticola sp. PURPLELP]